MLLSSKILAVTIHSSRFQDNGIVKLILYSDTFKGSLSRRYILGNELSSNDEPTPNAKVLATFHVSSNTQTVLNHVQQERIIHCAMTCTISLREFYNITKASVCKGECRCADKVVLENLGPIVLFSTPFPSCKSTIKSSKTCLSLTPYQALGDADILPYISILIHS